MTPKETVKERFVSVVESVSAGTTDSSNNLLPAFIVPFLVSHYNAFSAEKGPELQIFMEEESHAAPAEIHFEELNIIFRISLPSCFSVLFSEDVPFTD